MPTIASSDRSGGAQWMTRFNANQYVWDCLFCSNVFQQSSQTGPMTGAGNMGRSNGLNVVCPKCGSTNTSGPRLAQVDEAVSIYPANHPTGLDIYTGEEHVGSIDGV